MESHVKIVGLLHIILGSLGVLAALVLLMVFGGLAGLVRYSDTSPDAAVAIPVLGGIVGILFVLVLLFSLPGLIGGVGLMRLAPWSRVFMIVISALDLLHIPFGTALGIYGLWVLTKPETAALMDRRRAASPVY